MQLSPQQTQRISSVLGQKLKNRPCPLCGEQAWGWSADLIVLQTTRYEPASEFLLGLGGMGVGLPQQPPPPLAFGDIAREIIKTQPPLAYPTLPLFCNNCGNTFLLNVYALGIEDIWPAIASARKG